MSVTSLISQDCKGIPKFVSCTLHWVLRKFGLGPATMQMRGGVGGGLDTLSRGITHSHVGTYELLRTMCHTDLHIQHPTT